jgi:hypothetical protein
LDTSLESGDHVLDLLTKLEPPATPPPEQGRPGSPGEADAGLLDTDQAH